MRSRISLIGVVQISGSISFFIVFFIISLVYTFRTLKPFAALYFLEIEKIDESQQERNIAKNPVLVKENKVG